MVGTRLMLDIGCGDGHSALDHPAHEYVGVDVNASVLLQSPWRGGVALVCAAAEQLPFRDGLFSAIRSSVAIPYMDIPAVMRELFRVAAPGATLWISGHALRFTLSEFRAVRSLRALVYRLYVVANGLLFHLFGKVVAYPLKRTRIESFQTSRSLTRVLRQSGFVDIAILQRFPLIAIASKPTNCCDRSVLDGSKFKAGVQL